MNTHAQTTDRLVKLLRARGLNVDMVEQIGDELWFIAEEPFGSKRTGGNYRIQISKLESVIESVRAIKKPREGSEYETWIRLLEILNDIEMEPK